MWHKGWWNDYPHVLSQSTVPYSNTILFLLFLSMLVKDYKNVKRLQSGFLFFLERSHKTVVYLQKKKNEYSTQCTKGCLNLSSTSNIVRQPRITSSINALFWEHLNTIWQKPNRFFFFFFCLPPIAATDKQTKYLRMIPWDTLRVHLGLLSTFFVWPHPAKVLRSSDAFQLTQACEARFFLLSKSSPVFTLSTF